MAETFDHIANHASKILDLLDDVSASLENVLLAHGINMTPHDLAARSRRCKEARALCDELLRPAADIHEYAFDVELKAVVRVKASSENEARGMLALIEAVSPERVVERSANGEPSVEITEVSIVLDGDLTARLFEIDEEMINDPSQ